MKSHRSFFIAFLLITSQRSFAYEWPDLEGKNGAGNIISPIPSYLDSYSVSGEDSPPDVFNIYVWKDGERSKTQTIHKKQPCTLEAKEDGEPTQFSCSSKGTSPLAGVKYKVTVTKDHEGCPTKYSYICVYGCQSLGAPKRMEQNINGCE